jgi:signal transduction histidine kinase
MKELSLHILDVAKNSVKAGATLIQIDLHETDDWLTMTVTDNGCGILPDVLDRIFIPFFTTKSTGSGIGLSLCKQIVTMHGGSIRVTSEIGKGSCFVVKMVVK